MKIWLVIGKYDMRGTSISFDQKPKSKITGLLDAQYQNNKEKIGSKNLLQMFILIYQLCFLHGTRSDSYIFMLST